MVESGWNDLGYMTQLVQRPPMYIVEKAIACLPAIFVRVPHFFCGKSQVLHRPAEAFVLLGGTRLLIVRMKDTVTSIARNSCPVQPVLLALYVNLQYTNHFDFCYTWSSPTFFWYSGTPNTNAGWWRLLMISTGLWSMVSGIKPKTAHVAIRTHTLF
jgi:hypothetical protein